MMKILLNNDRNLAVHYSCHNSMKGEVKVQSNWVVEQGLHQIRKVKKEKGGLTILSNLVKVQINYLAGKLMISR